MILLHGSILGLKGIIDGFKYVIPGMLSVNDVYLSRLDGGAAVFYLCVQKWVWEDK
jgi:hypothetical protein